MKKIRQGFLVFAAMVLGMVCGYYGDFRGGEGATAEGRRALSMSPMTQKMLLAPGETYEGSFFISNPGEGGEDLYYEASVGSYALKQGAGRRDDYGDYDIEERTAQNMMVDWVRLEATEGVVPRNKQVLVKFFIDVPEWAPAGAQYATILIRDKGGSVEGFEGSEGSEEGAISGADEEGGVREMMQMAHILYATVAGATAEDGAVLENNVPAFLLDGNLEASTMVENRGNIYTEAEYVLQVWTNGGEGVCSNVEEKLERIVLPGTKRFYAANCKLPGPGIYKARQTVRIFGEESVVEGMVVYCPVWLMLVILSGVVFVSVYIIMVVTGKGRSKKKMKMGEEREE